jgi:hypothetical protein
MMIEISLIRNSRYISGFPFYLAVKIAGIRRPSELTQIHRTRFTCLIARSQHPLSLPSHTPPHFPLSHSLATHSPFPHLLSPPFEDPHPRSNMQTLLRFHLLCASLDPPHSFHIFPILVHKTRIHLLAPFRARPSAGGVERTGALYCEAPVVSFCTGIGIVEL